MITSPRNPAVSRTVQLKKRAIRDERRQFLVEGAQGVSAALAAGAALETLFVTPNGRLAAEAETAGVNIVEVSPAVMERLTSTVTPQGVVGVVPFLDVPLDALAEDPGPVAVLCSVRDPGNAGTVLRSADASGAGAMVLAGTSVDLYNPKTVRASAGSIFHLPVVRGVSEAETVDALRRRGVRVFATAATGGKSLDEADLLGPVAFLFGNEAHGLEPDVAALADEAVRIPMPGRAESINLAAAASVVLFETARRRHAGARASLEAIVHGAAHDIRSPVTAIRNFAEILLMRGGGLSPEDREVMLRGIVRDAEAMDQIVRRLIDATRLPDGDFFDEEVDVGEVVAGLAATAALDPAHPPIEYEGGAVTLRTDRVRLADALAACVEAEIWWASEGAVRIAAGTTGDGAHIAVWRRGSDLDAGEVDELFRPREPGTGRGSKFGLYVARELARLRGGDLRATVDDGLRFEMDLPFAPAG